MYNPLLAACLTLLCAAPAVAPPSLAGVAYDSAAPLAAVAAPLFDTHAPPVGARSFHVTYRGADGGSVPALLTVPGDGRGAAKRFAAVLLVHGLTGRKEDVYLLAVALARRGYATFAIDLAGHGERALPNRTLSDLSLSESRRLEAVSVVDLRRGVDYLATRSDIDRNRLACVGISLGGIYSAVFAGVEPRLRSVALWSAGGDWGKLLTESQHPLARRRSQGDTAPDAQTIEAALRDVDPLTYVSAIAPRPLLLLAGTDDAIVPNECTDELFAAAREPKRLIRYPGGHIPDPRAMTVRTMDFLDETLRAAKR